jgi:hypothetical protein
MLKPPKPKQVLTPHFFIVHVCTFIIILCKGVIVGQQHSTRRGLETSKNYMRPKLLSPWKLLNKYHRDKYEPHK